MRRYAILRTLIVLVAASGAAVANAADFSGKVVGVADGDTLTVLHEGTPLKIRLSGIDSPESGQPYGSRAKQAASELAFGKTVTVRSTGADRYGRTLAVVILPDGRTLNHEMVRSGFAWWFRQYSPADAILERLETEAKDGKRGLWSEARPKPPWEWRRNPSLPAGAIGKIIGNRNSHVYHRPGCPSAGKIAEKNRLVFETEAAAKEAGYRAGRDCHR